MISKKYKIQILLLLACILSPFTVFGQWECRSHLGANLKPIYKDSDLRWATELVQSGGYISDSYIANSMVFLGVDYGKNNHQLYAEGGYKYWLNNYIEEDYTLSNDRFGLRELSYSYSAPTFDIRLGLQQMRLSDYFLVNERAWGGSISKSLKNIELHAQAATVTKDFSRNGTFCSNGFLYDIVPTRFYPQGSSFGETNFASIGFTKKAGNKKDDSISETGGDEFEAFDEFESFSSEDENEPWLNLKSYGGLIYTEFGDYYEDPQVYGAVTAEFGLGKSAKLKAEGVYQEVSDNRALLLYLQANHLMEWSSNQTTNFQVYFLGKANVDEDAAAMPRFSNLFFGEVFRMDVIDLPLFNFSIKQQLLDRQLSFKLQYNHQVDGEQMREIDFSIGKFYFNKHLRITALTGLMQSDELAETAKLARVELRLFF